MRIPYGAGPTIAVQVDLGLHLITHRGVLIY